jgi:hypothetical protein
LGAQPNVIVPIELQSKGDSSNFPKRGGGGGFAAPIGLERAATSRWVQMSHAPLFDPTSPAFLENPYPFGGGIHFCLGAQLSRIEVECALDALLHRLPGFRLDDPLNPVWRPSVVFRGPVRLPATWTH